MLNEHMHGGTMGGVEELYKEVILDHFKSPKNKGTLASFNVKTEGTNPLCGDEVVLTAQVDGTRLLDIRVSGHGCAISQASASMMTELVKEKPVDDIKKLAALFKKMLGVDEQSSIPGSLEDLGDAVALEGVKKYPVRIKCALLPWITLLQALDERAKAG